MRLTRLIVLIMALITSAGFYMLYSYLTDDLESQTFQATEEALIDTAHILSAVIEIELDQNIINSQSLQNALTNAHARGFLAQVHNLTKTKVGSHVYITDAKGIVLYDSNDNQFLGVDLSLHNDVYLALKNEYGARSTRTDESDPDSSVLYVGVPIKKDEQILGTLTVYKPQQDVRLFITSRKKWITLSITMIAVGIIVFTISVFAWIFRPIGKLTRYAHSTTRGERPALPHLGRGREVNTLGTALKDMRETLDGRSYIENYIQILTHELKSPLAAIRGSSELLTEKMPVEQRKKFINNIENETVRSQRIIDGLLKLAQLEAQPHLIRKEAIQLEGLVSELGKEHSDRLATKNLDFQTSFESSIEFQGDPNLIKAALANLLENAIHFSPLNGVIHFRSTVKEGKIRMIIKDEGSGIPDYALERVFERFYSIGKSNSKQKSSGLGLAFVKEIIDLHQGSINIVNNTTLGVTVEIELSE